MAETPTRLVTADDLLRMPENGCRRELQRGELITMSPPGFQHARNVSRLEKRASSHVEQHGLGVISGAETGFRLASDPDTVRAPDLWFIRMERLREVGEPVGFWPGAPDLAAEFVSPSDSATDVDEKIAEYLAAGTRLVWVLYARTRHVLVCRADGTTARLGADDTLSGEDVIPGLTCSVREIFGS